MRINFSDIKTIFNLKLKNAMLEFLAPFGRKPQKFLAIDFSQAMTGIVYVESLDNGLKLLAYDIRKNSAAEKENDAAVVNSIKAFLEKNSIAEKDVMVSISDADPVVIKFLTLPFIPEKEIPGAAKWKLKDDVPFDLDQSAIAWQVVGDYVDSEGAKNRGMIFVVMLKEAIDRYLSIMGQCHLEPLGVTSSSFNYASLLQHTAQNSKVTAVLDVDYKGSTLSIYSGNKLNFVRRLSISWEKLTQSLTEVIVSGEGKIGLSHDEAQSIGTTFGIPEDENQTVKDKVQATRIISLLRPLLETLVRDLKFSFQYFASNFNTEPPGSLYLTGGGSNLKNLDKYLSKALNLEVSYLLLPGRVDARILEGGKLDQSSRNKIINALGAALGDPRAINLLPPEVTARRAERLQRVILRLFGIAAGAVFLFLLFSAQFQVRDYQSRVKNAQTHLRTVAEINVLKERVQAREDLIAKIQENRVPVTGVLKVISASVSAEIILNELSFDQAKHTLLLKGVIPAEEESAQRVLIDFMQRLELFSFFAEVSLVSSRRVETIQEFEILGEVVH
ncbi:MAG TPA: hypothetical protein DE315_00400 [Candidatus Omnitrophica bacterium]|nr:hypothetical protein [Candidatus Omnitrophota bacterium]HCI43982.1 hypothetical protein [Candidatus Omnitrophota bacterium]